MTVKETIWKIESHTEAKHAILKEYLKAWLPIMSSFSGRILYIDGFAGPGKYLDKDNQPTIDGSPLIAINAARKHKLQLNAEIVFLFIEARHDRCEYLKNLLASIDIPENMRYEVKESKFDETLSSLLDYLDEQKKRLAPAFVFIDPFGYSDTPFSLIKRIMENKKCEVLINLMYGYIKRALGKIKRGTPDKSDQERHLDILFGTQEWRKTFDIDGSPGRKEFIQQLYKRRLKKEAKIKYVRFFEMINKFNQTEYFLFFGTNKTKGLKEMKRSMWKVSPTGAFRFSDRTNPDQTAFFAPKPNYNLLKKLILKEFSGKTVPIKQIEEFVVIKTPFRETHYKKQILKPMEDVEPPEIRVKGKPGRRRGTYPPGTVVKFL